MDKEQRLADPGVAAKPSWCPSGRQTPLRWLPVQRAPLRLRGWVLLWGAARGGLLGGSCCAAAGRWGVSRPAARGLHLRRQCTRDHPWQHVSNGRERVAITSHIIATGLHFSTYLICSRIC